MEQSKYKPISSITLGKILTDAGIIPDNCRRVVIDINCTDAVKIHYEVYGDDRIIEVLQNPAVVAVLREQRRIMETTNLSSTFHEFSPIDEPPYRFEREEKEKFIPMDAGVITPRKAES